MAYKPVFPLQQGDLDYLCSIYAVLNLGYLHGTIGTLEDAKHRFDDIVREIPKAKGDLPAYVTKGIDPGKDFAWALEQAKLTKGTLDTSPSYSSLRSDLENDRHPIPVYVVGKRPSRHFSHYTIATGVHPNGNIALFDSYGFVELVRKVGALILGSETVKLVASWSEVRPGSA